MISDAISFPSWITRYKIQGVASIVGWVISYSAPWVWKLTNNPVQKVIYVQDKHNHAFLAHSGNL